FAFLDQVHFILVHEAALSNNVDARGELLARHRIAHLIDLVRIQILEENISFDSLSDLNALFLCFWSTSDIETSGVTLTASDPVHYDRFNVFELIRAVRLRANGISALGRIITARILDIHSRRQRLL